ncbi:MAG: sugar phosphate isomerase/epimerase, partial [Planctomycetes bacterium]|nr:sugar phosphate isomerase/epimerase [Planctomycetota bacterium]
MFLGYNTNGFAHHTTRDAATILCEIGYRSIALTLERSHLDPPDRSAVKQCIEYIGPITRDAGLRVTIETGSRFILDAHRKHQPTLLSASAGDRERRVEFILAAVEVAAAMEADSVSLWSGTADDAAEEAALFDRLVTGLRKILAHAESHNVRLSFEPEPGMFVETMAQFERLIDAVDHPLLGLTLDVGHVHCLGDGDVADHVRRWKNKLWNLHIEDMRRGEHNHLMFGEGDMDFPAVF